MRKFKPSKPMEMHESKDGEYVLLREAAVPMQAALIFAIQRQCEIEDDVNGFGVLKPILAMAKCCRVN